MPLIRNGCLNVTVSRRDLVKISFLALARASTDSMRIESLSRFFRQPLLQTVCSQLGNTALHPALSANTRYVRLLSPKSHDFLSRRRPRPSALDRIGRIVIARRRGMA